MVEMGEEEGDAKLRYEEEGEGWGLCSSRRGKLRI